MISRTAVYAFAIAAGGWPVSSCMRSVNVAPMRLTIELVTAVAMISRLQAMALHVLGVFLLQRHREIARELLRKIRIFGHVRIEQLLDRA